MALCDRKLANVYSIEHIW